jgi:uncharacterized protein (DUF2147 family)
MTAGNERVVRVSDELGRRLGRSAIILAVLLGSAAGGARPGAAGTLDGLWQNRIGTLDVLIAPCGARYCGTIVASRGESAAHARSKGVTSLVGTRVLENFASGANGIWRGSVYAPQLNRRLSSKLKFLDSNRIELTTCLLGGFLCDSNIWHRIQS